MEYNSGYKATRVFILGYEELASYINPLLAAIPVPQEDISLLIEHKDHLEHSLNQLVVALVGDVKMR